MDVLATAATSPITANLLKTKTVTHTNDADFTMDASGRISVNAYNSAVNQSTSYQDEVTVVAENTDGSTVSTRMYFRNTAYLNICYCCSSYANYGYYPGGLVDGTTTGGWHSNESGTPHVAEDVTPTHYLLVDFKEDFQMTGVEIWRNSTDTKALEIYYAPSTVAVTAGNANNANFTTWRSQILADGTRLGGIDFTGVAATAPQVIETAEPFTARYIMVRITASNRGNSHNLMEIYPYVVISE